MYDTKLGFTLSAVLCSLMGFSCIPWTLKVWVIYRLCLSVAPSHTISGYRNALANLLAASIQIFAEFLVRSAMVHLLTAQSQNMP